MDAIDNKLRARITAIEEEEVKTKPKGFHLRTLVRANETAGAGKERRLQASAKPEAPKNAAKHDRPFSCFFGKSSSKPSNAYDGSSLLSSSNNRDLQGFSVPDKVSGNKSREKLRPSWTVL